MSTRDGSCPILINLESNMITIIVKVAISVKRLAVGEY